MQNSGKMAIGTPNPLFMVSEPGHLLLIWDTLGQVVHD